MSEHNSVQTTQTGIWAQKLEEEQKEQDVFIAREHDFVSVGGWIAAAESLSTMFRQFFCSQHLTTTG